MAEADLRIERAVVTGGRSFTDGTRIEADLRALLPLGLRQVAEGASPAGGADDLAYDAWHLLCNLPTRRYYIRPDLDGQGRPAPVRRSIRMLETERPDLVLAYPDQHSSGTWHCVAEAWRRRIPVLVWVSWLTGGEASRLVQRKMEERRVSLVIHRQGILETLAFTDRNGHRIVIAGDENFADALPEELDG